MQIQLWPQRSKNSEDLLVSITQLAGQLDLRLIQAWRSRLGKRIDCPVLLSMLPDSARPRGIQNSSSIDGLNSDRLCVWSEKNPLTAKELATLKLGRNYSLYHPISIPVHQIGSVTWDWTFARAVDQCFSSEEVSRLCGAAYVITDKLFDFTPLPSAEDNPLSDRELEILTWVTQSKSYPAIGQILDISPKTVEYHMTNIMRKLAAQDKLSAILAALKAGWIKA